MLKKESGFSLVEVLIAVGLMGGLALFLMQQQDTSTKMQTKMRFDQDLNTVNNSIQTMLAKRAVCTLTLSGRRVGDSISVIKSGEDNLLDPLNGPPREHIGREVARVNTVVGQTGLQISSMSLIEKRDAAGIVIGDALRVQFRAGRMGSDGRFIPIKALGSTNLNKDYLVNGLKNGAGQYISCYSEMGNMVDSAIQEACRSMGATWNASTKRCLLTNLPQCIIAEGSACGSVYTQQGSEFTLESKIFKGRTCTQRYEKNSFCIGPGSFNRSCDCPSKGCTCDTGGVSCYSRKDKTCEDHEDSVKILSRKCCRPS